MIARPISEVVAQEVGDGFFALGRKFERNRIVGLLRLHLRASEADFIESLIAAPTAEPPVEQSRFLDGDSAGDSEAAATPNSGFPTG